jgi:hypothetical protein
MGQYVRHPDPLIPNIKLAVQIALPSVASSHAIAVVGRTQQQMWVTEACRSRTYNNFSLQALLHKDSSEPRKTIGHSTASVTAAFGQALIYPSFRFVDVAQMVLISSGYPHTRVAKRSKVSMYLSTSQK